MSVMELALVASSVVLSVLVYLLIRGSLKRLLDEVVKLPAGRTFYLRTLLITMLLGALAGTVTVSISNEPKQVPFMESVWTIASSLSTAFWAMMVILLVYVVLQTVLVVALRRPNEQ